ncbi:monovalent cation:proton antiporter-2 (CPA2) family protein [Psychrosphaera aestuarii]|uniref:monovalent cation:proton antiporter-2 (CPA2) family protein n=1 Tax=Psychrosphaera aestuarii TaxID=1266052 RepID=UPI001B330415|nr:monovalent cation:proton antiporter-2 (CPA2) family protein [Psychrosphaera aestuarii]
MEHNLLADAVTYLFAAVVSVPIAKRLGLGSVLGYLVAGVIIGPFALSLLSNPKDVMHFAEFGVVLMLFLIGLELKPSLLWKLRVPILGSGGLQVFLTTLFVTAIGLFFGLPWQQALAIGMILSLSSTAIALQSLQEKGQMKSTAGQSAFAVLLFQDIAVIPMLAILPLLVSADSMGIITQTEGLHGWKKGLVAGGIIAGIVIGGRFLMNPIFSFIAKSQIREVFTATALLLVISVALAMQAIGLSPALGTFLAGVVLAESDYRHELESNIEPFKGLLLGLFFISVGASIDFNIFAADPALIIFLTIGLILLKYMILQLLGRFTPMAKPDRYTFSFVLAQAGEFAFVLFAFALGVNLLPQDLVSQLTLVVALSMLLTPLMLIVNDKYVQPMFRETRTVPASDSISEDNKVIIIGFGRFGQAVGRLLAANKIPTTILDHDASQIDMVRRYGYKVYFGEGERHELLHAAGAEDAEVIVVAVDEPERSLRIIKSIQRHFPHVKILARAINRPHATDLLKAGVTAVERETLAGGLELGAKVMTQLGWRPNAAWRASRLFKKHDDEMVEQLATMTGDEKMFINHSLETRSFIEKTLEEDQHWEHEVDEHAWERPGKLKKDTKLD